MTGKPIYDEDLIKETKSKDGEIIVVFCNEQFIGMYKVVNDKNVFAKAEFVMQEIR